MAQTKPQYLLIRQAQSMRINPLTIYDAVSPSSQSLIEGFKETLSIY
jgi:hypothetical protein